MTQPPSPGGRPPGHFSCETHMVDKLRVLWCGEASYLSTGYATYGLELLKRLHASGKYELFELGSYGGWNDSRAANLPWQFRSVSPDPSNQVEQQIYHADPSNQFGAWRFEQACLDFRPDVVCDIRDWWMFEHQERSPLRPYFRHLVMPTVDAEPQDEQWLATFASADGVFTYTDWGANVLRRQGGGRIPVLGAAPPGADLNTLRPVQDKAAHRRALGVDEEALIVGTVMRNQRRKLYPDLLEGFAKLLESAPKSVADRAYLYMHTTWPDVGWDLPRLILESGIGHRCLFTYVCRSCGAVYPSFFQDALAHCKRCGQASAGFPTSRDGVSRKALSDIINLFDVYVQYANSEGFGMPQVEAAACGVPVVSVDYSAMSDVVRKLGGTPVRVERFYREPETHCKRALPDNAHLAQALSSLLARPPVVLRLLGANARKAVETHYTYDRTAEIWMRALDTMPAASRRWGDPPNLHQLPSEIPPGLSDDEFVRWGITQVAGRPELADSYTALRMTRDLQWGITLPSTGGVYFNDASTLASSLRHEPFDRSVALTQLTRLGEQKNFWEKRRCGS